MKTGKSSFRELFGAGQRVEIPIIQRDYAQGREDEHSREVRKHFVEALSAVFSADRAEDAPLSISTSSTGGGGSARRPLSRSTGSSA